MGIFKPKDGDEGAIPRFIEHSILKKMSFTQFLMFGYSVVILVGAVILCLPISGSYPKDAQLFPALYSAASLCFHHDFRTERYRSYSV